MDKANDLSAAIEAEVVDGNVRVVEFEDMEMSDTGLADGVVMDKVVVEFEDMAALEADEDDSPGEKVDDIAVLGSLNAKDDIARVVVPVALALASQPAPLALAAELEADTGAEEGAAGVDHCQHTFGDTGEKAAGMDDSENTGGNLAFADMKYSENTVGVQLLAQQVRAWLEGKELMLLADSDSAQLMVVLTLD
ncbi:hypothetical protein L1987_63006 [Smallanthus sonchifolius]|uniref:Uncharacterized protein n=1 Tax=Smallanthus sonchifolius TaxID=185202 RepID=A0ACB9CC18_9ASTR|nr:hypothetical protein L1987_63006 [Smallanthus sonchifolius]